MKKLLLFFSAFAPLYFLLIVKILIDIIFGDLHFNVLNTISLILFSIALISGIAGAVTAVKHKHTPRDKIKIVKKQSLTEQYFLGYFSLFVLFALSFEIEKVSMFVVFVLIIILIGVVYIRNDLYYINPFLNLLGYNFYLVTFSDKNQDEQVGKFLFKGMLETGGEYTAKLSHENFSLIEDQADKNERFEKHK